MARSSTDLNGKLANTQARPSDTTFGPGIRLGRILSFEITLDFSLLLVFGLVLINLGGGVFPAWHPDWSRFLDWSVAFVAALAFFGSILLHELSHAIVGRALGTPVRGITLFMFGGMAQMEREPERASAEFWMAIAGPLTSLVLGLASMLLGIWLAGSGVALPSVDAVTFARHLSPLSTLLLWLGPLNIALAVFNALPGFPLDGGRILRAAIWWATKDLLRATRIASQVGVFISWALIGCGIIMAFGFYVPFFGRGLGSGLWLVLIGWFLGHAARASYASLITKRVLEHVPVRDLMWTGSETTVPQQTIRNLVRQQMQHSEQQLFPVLEQDQLVGAVTLANLHQIPEDVWDTMRVERVMIEESSLVALSPDSEATQALRLLSESRVPEIPVIDQGRFLGLVRQKDVLRWLSMHVDPAQATL